MPAQRQFSTALFLRITVAALCHSFCHSGARAQAPASQLANPAPALLPNEVLFSADNQSTDGRVWRYLRGHVEIHKEQMVLTADEVDYNEQTEDVEARGNVHFSHPARKEDVYASRFQYNLGSEIGMFYDVHGTVSSASQGSPRVLHTNEPFYFQGETAQKIRDHYIVHNGWITDCKVPHPWWRLRTPQATIVPGRYALLRRPLFRLRGVPLFYAPLYYKSLERLPRSSGFLTPNIGNSSRRGRVLGESFFWAINRSLDMMLGATYFSARGLAEQITARARPTQKSYFDAYFFNMNDRGIGEGEARRKQGGQTFTLNGRAELPWGFRGVVNVTYLSSLEFRQAFTETLNEAIISEAHSVGFVTKSVSTFFINGAVIRSESFRSTTANDTIVIRKLPSLEFDSWDHELVRGPLPLWFSLEAEADLLGRKEPGFETRFLSERVDVFPRVYSKFYWRGFHFAPGFGLHGTHYGEQLRSDGTVSGQGMERAAREFTLELAPPSFERVFNGPKVLADKLKHVIEPRLSYRYVTGVPDFSRVIRFDERDLLNNTNEAELAIINHFYGKREASGVIRELFSLEVWQRRYFDPTFGGALVPGARNVFQSTVDLTSFAFADQPRNYSPLVTILRAQPLRNYNVEWRNDYDPQRGKLVNSGVTADVTVKAFGFSLGHYAVRSPIDQTLPSNQLRTTVRYGSVNKRGWNTGMNVVYDYRQGLMQYATVQVTYNTDCCGFSVEFRRFALGATRNDNNFRFALSIANIGSFGNLKKQERMF